MFFSSLAGCVVDEKSLWKTFMHHPDKSFEGFQKWLLFQPERLKEEIKDLHGYLLQQRPQNTFQWHLFDFLCVLGTIFAFCSGFDGLVSVLSMAFPELFFGFSIALGVISALCALGIFLARDKLSIADALGLEIETTQDEVDQYLFKIQRYYHIQSEKKLSDHDKEALSEWIDEYRILVHLLDTRYALNKKRMNDIDVYLQSNIVILIGGIILFSDGFFVGQSVGFFVANFIMCNAFILTLSLGLGIGFCGLASYLYVERPSLERFLYGVLFTNQEEAEKRLTETQNDLSYLGFGLSA